MLRKLKLQIPGEPLAARYNWCQGPVPGRGPAVEKHWYTLLVKMSGCTVTSYLAEKLSKLRRFDRQLQKPRTVLSSRLSQQNCAVQSGNPTVTSVYLPTPRWHHLKTHPFLAVHSADQHRMIYSFSNTTSYSTFYAFFSSFRITLWPMRLANSKRQPCFYPPQSHAQEDTKNWQTWWETCAVPENIQFSFSCSFFTRLTCTV